MIDGEAPVRADAKTLDRSLASGLAWTGFVKALTQAASWAMTILVARLLTPTDYGLFGMAMVFVQLTSMATEFGLGSTLVYLRELDGRRIAQLHGLAIALGVAGAASAAAAALPMSWFFRSPPLVPVLLTLAVTFVIDALRTVPLGTLMRDMRFKRLAALDVAKAFLVSAATVALAWAGFGYWSLVMGNVLSSLLSSVLVLSWAPQRAAWPRWAELRPTLGFIADIIRARMAWWGYTNADFVVAGRMLGVAPLGSYTCAWTTASAPMEKIVAVFGRVLPPLFSMVAHDPALARRYLLGITEVLMLLVAPASIGLALVADDFVSVLLGPQWAGAVTPLRILCCFAVIHAPATLWSHVLNAAGRSRFAMRLHLVALVVLPITFIAAGRAWGVNGIAAVWIAVYPMFLVPLLTETVKAVGCSITQYAGSMRPAASGVAVMVSVVVAVLVFLGRDMSPVVRLTSCVAAGALAYAGTILALYAQRIRSWRTILAEL